MYLPSDQLIESTLLTGEFIGLEKLPSHLSSQKFAELLKECLDMVIKKTELYGGKITNLDGESFKAVFGLPEQNKNSAENAMEASIDLMERIKIYNQVKELPYPVHLRLGLETGPLIISTLGEDENSRINVFGETLNLVIRIRDFAESDQILAGQKIYDQLKEKYSFLPLEPIPVKGQKNPLPVFEFNGRKKKEVTSGITSSRMIVSEMVGRQVESELLQNKIHELLQGKGAVVNVIGKAGIGKSRLIAETRQKELMKQIALFEGRAVSNGQNLSFHPIIQIIKSWAGITEEDLPSAAVEKLQSNIRRIYNEAFDEVFPFVATMMGYRLEGKAKERLEGIEGEALENLILKNVRDLLARATQIRPVFIIVEDAHWCDISSVKLMESLFKLSRNRRILFVNVFRPGYKETGERISKFLEENLKENFLEIFIESLNKEESELLIRNLLHKASLPEEINNQIIERSVGNPFFIEEVLRSFIDDGLIGMKDDAFTLTDNIKLANIPESVDKVILSRIERLDENTKELLKTASVIGRNFYYKILEDAARNIEEIDHKLEYLKDVQLVNERKQKDEVEFLFKHALAQQATYDSIMEKTRKDLHLKIATSIEKVFETRINEFYGMLAHHYSKAGQQDKAEEYFIKAGEESMKSGASSEAVNFLKRALELIDHKNKQNQQKIIDLEEKLAKSLAITGQYAESIKYCDRIIAHHYKPFPKSKFGKLLGLMVNILLLYRMIYFYKYKPNAKSDEINNKLIKVLVTQSHSFSFTDPKRLFFDTPYGTRFVKRKQFGPHEAITMILLGTVFFYTGYFFNLGKKLVEWGSSLMDERFILEWTRIKNCISHYDYVTGKKADFSDEEKVVKYAIQTGDFFFATQYYYYCILNSIEGGEASHTLHFLNRILQIYEAFDSNSCYAQYHRMHITHNLKLRKFEEVIRITDEVFDFIRRNEFSFVLIALYSYRSMAYTFRGDYAEAKKNLLKAEKIVKNLKILTLVCVYLIAKCYYEIAIFKTNSGNSKDAIKTLRTTDKLIKLARKIKKNQPEAYRLRATIFWLINKPGKASRSFGKSIKAGLDYDCKLELSRTFFEAGRFLNDPKNKKERINGMNATECLLKAKSMFEEMNLEWDLKAYEEYLQGK